MDTLVSGIWEIAGVPIILWKWSIIFYAKHARAEKEPIWIKLSCLPPHLWNIVLFKMIGDVLGVYVDTDLSYKVIGEMSIARILVLLDLHEGLTRNLLENGVRRCFPRIGL